MIATSPEIERYTSLFEQLESQTGGPNWLKAIRRAGIDRFASVGFPTTRHEEWRFTPISPIIETSFEPARFSHDTSGSVESRLYDDSAGARIVFVNGCYSRELSNVDGLPGDVI